MVEKRLCCSGPVAQVLSVWCPPGSMFFIHVYNPSIFFSSFHPFVHSDIFLFPSVCPSWEKDPSSVAIPEVSPISLKLKFFFWGGGLI